MTFTHPSLTDRVVVITGGSRGLGREMALELAGAGARVVITGATASPALATTLTDLARLAGADRVAAEVCDVADAEACVACVAAISARFGRVDVLVNNAGLGMRVISETYNTVPTRFWQADPAAWQRVVATNFNGAFHMARAVAPGMIANRFGKIINISTSDQTMVRAGYAPYGPSKAALEAAARVWARDLDGTGVDVNVYLPGGAADTDLLPDGPGKRGADGNLLPATIMRRGIGWLASDLSNGTTGARFIARLWDEAKQAAEAAAGARVASVAAPAIM